MPDESIPEKKRLNPDEVTKVCQSHINKLIPIATAVEVEILSNPNIPEETLLTYYKQQRDLEGLIGWIIQLEKKYNPTKVIPVGGNKMISR